ncbi:MAG: hypothetical protein J6V09_02595 [Clostridia bacterium]|nr:hypothetical protein [Clostridia bacterium]
MKFINLEFDGTREAALAILRDNERVNRGVRFDARHGKPVMRIKEKENGKIRITCELTERPTKDNAFLVGTYFSGRLTESGGVTRLRGVITTAPIYHIFLLCLTVVFIIRCIQVGGFSPIPLIILAFNAFMFKDEWKKQGYIERYFARAAKRIKEK